VVGAEQHLTAADPLPAGRATVGIEFTKTGQDGSFPTGTATLHVNDQPVATRAIRIQPGFFSLSGEGINVGLDRGQPLTQDYRTPFALTGATIERVLITTGPDIYLDLEHEAEANFIRD
jgi:hypothetical protein